MHRSGTSAITQILSKAGFYLGDPSDIMHGNQWNPDGYFERLSVVMMNDIILYLAGGSWHSPPDEKNIFRLRLDPKIEALLNAYKGNDQAVIKDPRMCLTFPVWKDLLSNNARIIYIRRNPDTIASSLQKRDGFSREKGVDLCRIYSERVKEYMADLPHFLINYEDLMSEERPAILSKLAMFLNIDLDLEGIAKTTVGNYLLNKGKKASVDQNNQVHSINVQNFDRKNQDQMKVCIDKLLTQNNLGLITTFYTSIIAEKDDQIKDIRAELDKLQNSKTWKISKSFEKIYRLFS